MKYGFVQLGMCNFVWCFLLLISRLTWAEQADQWQSDSPTIFDRKILVMQHYDKKLFSVLPDTVTATSSLRHKTWVALNRVVIPSGVNLVVPADTRFFFEPNASLIVEGTLEAVGTKESSIQLTVINKEDMYIAPKTGELLWRGIEVGKKGRLLFKNVLISESQFGVVSDGLCDSLSLQNVIFSGAGNATVSFSEQNIPVNLDIPFSLSCPKPKLGLRAIDNNGYRIASNFFMVETVALIIAGAVTSAIAYNTDQKVKTSKDHTEAQRYSNKATTFYNISAGCYIGAGACSVPAVIFRVIFKAGKGS